MPQIPSYTAKTVLTDNDLFVIADSAAANATKKATRAAILSDATALIFTIGGTPTAKITSIGVLTDKLTGLTPATNMEITSNLGLILTAVGVGDIQLVTGTGRSIAIPDGVTSGAILVGGASVFSGNVLGVTSITVVNGLVTQAS